ncbi:MAG TPA: PepSY-like domain-containing protein [Chitinophagales bacterium]|nr:PepSY-like domain-containing protein [Chitinophagales bacterium]
MSKLTITIAAVLGLAFNVLAGDGPAAAEKALAATYPKAEDIIWSKESANNYQAAFLYSGVYMWVNYNEDGKWLQTKTAIALALLPNPVTDYVKKNYGTNDILTAKKIERPEADILLYELEVNTARAKVKVIVNERGVLVK